MVNVLLNDIVTVNKNHLTTGIVGTKYLLEVLSAINRTDLAYELMIETTYPSFGYMVANTATTLWYAYILGILYPDKNNVVFRTRESWYGTEYVAIASRNHIMFGSQSAWYFRTLAGINLARDSVAWNRIVIHPHIDAVRVHLKILFAHS